MQAAPITASLLLTVIWVLVTAGCGASKGQLTSLETQNRVLTEQNRAQLVEIQNLRTFARDKEDQVAHAEQELAASQQKAALDQQRLANRERPAADPTQPVTGWTAGQRRPD